MNRFTPIPAARLPALLDRFTRMFGCDQARITSPSENHFLILGWKSNTAEDRKKNPEAGQWTKDGVPYDFDYIHEEVVASGRTEAELITYAEHYKRLMGLTMEQYMAEMVALSQGEREV